MKENTGANYDVFQVECEDLDGDDLKFKVEWETNHGNDVFTFDTDSRSHLFAWIIFVPVNHLSFMSEWVFPKGGTLIFSYIRRLGLFFGVQNFEFQYFLGFFRKMNIFWGYEIVVDIFWGSSQNWTKLNNI